MTMNAVAMMQANTTSQMIVERPRDADLFWFWRLKGEASDVCGDASMMAFLSILALENRGLREKQVIISVKTSFCQLVPRGKVGREGIHRSWLSQRITTTPDEVQLEINVL